MPHPQLLSADYLRTVIEVNEQALEALKARQSIASGREQLYAMCAINTTESQLRNLREYYTRLLEQERAQANAENKVTA